MKLFRRDEASNVEGWSRDRRAGILGLPPMDEVLSVSNLLNLRTSIVSFELNDISLFAPPPSMNSIISCT